MTFTRRISRGEHIYLYRVTSYRESGKVKQKTEYIGTEVKKDGKTTIKPPKHKCSSIRKILSYGAPIALLKQAKEFGLFGLINKVFSGYTNIENVGQKIVILAMNKILKDDAINNIANWFESTSLPKQIKLSGADFSPKKIRGILNLLSNENPDYYGMIEQEIVETIKQKYEQSTSMLVYDLTAITFYGSSNELAKYGHAYKKKGLEKQINLVLAITKDLKLPIHHRVLHGNILSVSTINRLVGELKGYNMKDIIVIMDRGFYSKRNMEELDPDYKIIGSLPSNLKIWKEAVTINKDIENTGDFFKYKEEVFFFKEQVIDWKKIIVYHSSRKYSEDLQNFYGDICEIEEHLKGLQEKRFSSRNDLIAELTNICGEYFRYIKFMYKRGWTFSYCLNQKEILQRKKGLGKIVLFTTTKLEAKEILILYREKDVIEKTFNVMKGKGLEPLKSTLDSTTRAYVRLVGVGYLLLALMKNRVTEGNMSLQKIIDHLSNVREVLYYDGSTVIADFTKQQREIMEQLNMV